MEVYRLSREAFARDLSGKGAALKGGRWNSVGVEVMYTASNRSLAMAEVAVHFTLATLPSDYCMITLNVPDHLTMSEVKLHQLPHDWAVFPHPSSTQRIGDEFVASNKHCLLKIPSVVTQGDFNYLINPLHKDFHRIKLIRVEKFPFDKRIFT